jgi:hypothetical protein
MKGARMTTRAPFSSTARAFLFLEKFLKLTF